MIDAMHVDIASLATYWFCSLMVICNDEGLDNPALLEGRMVQFMIKSVSRPYIEGNRDPT